MTAPPPWIGWSRSKSAASPSRPRRRHLFLARSSRSTLSTRRATWISPSRWSARLRVLDGAVAVFDACCGCRAAVGDRMAPGRQVRRAAYDASSTRWTAPARTSHRCVEMIVDRLGRQAPLVTQLPIGSRGQVCRCRRPDQAMKAIIWKDESLGAEFLVRARIPGGSGRSGPSVLSREDWSRLAVEQDDDAMEAYLEGNEPDEETLKALHP